MGCYMPLSGHHISPGQLLLLYRKLQKNTKSIFCKPELVSKHLLSVSKVNTLCIIRCHSSKTQSVFIDLNKGT